MSCEGEEGNNNSLIVQLKFRSVALFSCRGKVAVKGSSWLRSWIVVDYKEVACTLKTLWVL